MKKTYKTRFCLGFMLGAVLMLLPASLLQAAPPTPADSPCDVNYYTSLKARAWMEAQREITQNQNLIFKPDSVLEYTCFDRYLSELAGDATTLFSENPRWAPPTPAATRMDTALQNLVGNALVQYISGNFGHAFLGDRLKNININGSTQTIDYVPAAVNGDSYSCNQMNEVWKLAKCMNFIADPATDGFYPFSEYATDKRTRPEVCGNVAAWADNINAAKNVKPGSTPPTVWPKDNVNTFFKELDPANCGTDVKPIATGVIVNRPKVAPTQYEEKICAAPGCYYVPSGESSGTCQNL